MNEHSGLAHQIHMLSAKVRLAGFTRFVHELVSTVIMGGYNGRANLAHSR
jgi:hypothetical protein